MSRKKLALVGEPYVSGQLQEYKGAEEFKSADNTDWEKVHLGPGPWLYREWDGVAKAFVPVETPTEKPMVYVEEVDWSQVPPVEELCYLYHAFFKKYDREVLIVVGKSRSQDEHFYFVPKQVGTGGGVEWKADDDMDEFQRVAQWVGTIHVHPGVSAEASGIDVDEWAEPKKSGLHIIFGRDGTFHVYLAVAGRTILVLESTVSGVSSLQVVLWTSHGKPLKELLLKPKPMPMRRPPEGRIPHQYGRDWGGDGREDYWEDPMWKEWEKEQESRFPVRDEEIQDLADVGEEWARELEGDSLALLSERGDQLVSVESQGFWYVMRKEEYEELQVVLGAQCPPAYHVGTVGAGRRVR
jgi:proteasome lid subunit RPN8/RPN11